MWPFWLHNNTFRPHKIRTLNIIVGLNECLLNVAHLHYIDLYGNIFQPYDKIINCFSSFILTLFEQWLSVLHFEETNDKVG